MGAIRTYTVESDGEIMCELPDREAAKDRFESEESKATFEAELILRETKILAHSVHGVKRVVSPRRAKKVTS